MMTLIEELNIPTQKLLEEWQKIIYNQMLVSEKFLTPIVMYDFKPVEDIKFKMTYNWNEFSETVPLKTMEMRISELSE